MRLNRIIILIMSVLIFGCQHGKIKVTLNIDHYPDIFPDYTNVTIPYNIAPLNFRVNEEGEKILVSLNSKNQRSEFEFKGNKVIFPEKKWAALLKSNCNDSLEISVKVIQNGNLKKFRPFKIYISGDPVDGYLVYRLLMPGFQNWNQMGIYQRSLSTFKTETIIDSRILPGTCMNCHSFAMNDPQNMVFHLRESYGGTILVRGDKVEKLNTKAGKMFGNAAFPYWHPSKRYIAFSVNKVNQIFHAIGPSRASAIDMKSDIFVYDIEKNEMLTSPLISAEENFETFPCFSPDGLKLYYCGARAVKLPEKFDMIKYSLCSVSFNPSTGKFGDKTDTLISGPSIHKSISIPRISPDNRFLMFTMANYGCFPSYNPEADLYLLDLGTGHYESLDILNSNNTESWHSWSSDGHWIVFSSRRGDGLYSKPYLAYIDKSGKARKPFLLPQKDPNFYDTVLFSFNVPELVKSRVMVNSYSIERIAKKSPSVQVMTGSGH
jgi:hypothetical protein